jgi:ABC-type histidine transport system ATPase subunit
MNRANMPADQVQANQWQGMLRDWRALLVWEIVVTVLTLVMIRQHLGLAVSVAVIDLAAVVQTHQVVKTRSTSSVGQTRQRASVTTGLGGRRPHHPCRRSCGSCQRPLIARTRCAGPQQPHV